MSRNLESELQCVMGQGDTETYQREERRDSVTSIGWVQADA